MENSPSPGTESRTSPFLGLPAPLATTHVSPFMEKMILSPVALCQIDDFFGLEVAQDDCLHFPANNSITSRLSNALQAAVLLLDVHDQNEP
jgi:hypothetical protein